MSGIMEPHDYYTRWDAERGPDPWEGHKCKECGRFGDVAGIGLCVYSWNKVEEVSIGLMNEEDDACEEFTETKLIDGFDELDKEIRRLIERRASCLAGSFPSTSSQSVCGR